MSIKIKYIVLIIVICFSLSETRVFSGQCRKRPAPVVRPFFYRFYLGLWYEIEWYDDEYPTDDECIKFTYNHTLPFQFNMTLELKKSNDSWKDEVYEGHGSLSRIPSPPYSHKLVGQLNTTFSTGPAERINHEILATDYCSYAFVWDCQNVNATHYNEKMWYFSRNPNPTERPKTVNYLITKYFDQQFIRKTYHGPK